MALLTPLLTAATATALAHDELARLMREIIYWLQGHWLRLLVASALAVLLYAAIRLTRRRVMRLCVRKGGGARGWWRVAGRTASRTGIFFSVMVAVELVRVVADPPDAVNQLVHMLFIIASVFQSALWARELIVGAVETHADDPQVTTEALSSAMGIVRVLVTVAVFAVALVVVLDNLGVNVTGLVASLGIGGIAIGIAAQSIFADLFAALAIIFDKPFRRGDFISYGGSAGTVEEIGLKSTRVRGVAGEARIIANRKLLDQEIQNISSRDYRRISFALAIAQSATPEQLRRIPALLKEEVERVGLRFVQAGFTGFGSSSHDFQIDCDSPGADWAAFFQRRHEVGMAIIARLAAEGIALAYPAQTSFTAAPDGRLIMPYPDDPPR
ncbi:mechanosensitive ion channel domain-containing protein [Sphingomonas sp.]|uniref:mechanosensitive ion channel family protein n=1 Tax=Sphingomonas sp. TaxID=28214 RepID=UPI001E119014|nr:mechanosensitive ion channel domain-containing protein [Sphingomonas sp.]MBX9796917.1 mechanosensitive ion channel family protein [Sphingomonas sp.]